VEFVSSFGIRADFTLELKPTAVSAGHSILNNSPFPIAVFMSDSEEL
jgi:hypothetical protein